MEGKENEEKGAVKITPPEPKKEELGLPKEYRSWLQFYQTIKKQVGDDMPDKVTNGTDEYWIDSIVQKSLTEILDYAPSEDVVNKTIGLMRIHDPERKLESVAVFLQGVINSLK